MQIEEIEKICAICKFDREEHHGLDSWCPGAMSRFLPMRTFYRPTEDELDAFVDRVIAQVSSGGGEQMKVENTRPIQPIGSRIIGHQKLGEWFKDGYAKQEADGLWLHYAAVCMLLSEIEKEKWP